MYYPNSYKESFMVRSFFTRVYTSVKGRKILDYPQGTPAMQAYYVVERRLDRLIERTQEDSPTRYMGTR